MAEQTLAAVPSLSSLYANALGRSARLMVRPLTQSTTLPDVVYRVADVPVDAEQLVSYQRVLGDVAASDRLPAGFVHVLGFPVAMAVMAREDFPLPLLGMVHVANRVDQLRALHIGEALEVRAWAEHLAAHRKGTQVELVVEVTGSATDGVAWRGRSTYLARGRTLPGLPAAPETPSAGTAWGQKLPQPTAQWHLGADTGRRYAEVSGDRNPIHMGSVPARLFGFKRAIAHGMYTAARALTAAVTGGAEVFSWDVTFGKPVLLPGRVAFAVRPAGGSGVSEGTAAGVEYLGWNARSGARHFSGSVTPLR
ncbi:MaoC family dehydratase [Ruania albidiflava]|uniref:MaoC family dehydratase n=1 Tax=Ruania albidiflava TaxID=366586 RepID=UPI0003B4082C|nr:MaoC/PaaZ C-terminal domain-containing protein [Ruania albidiflava]